MPRGWRWPAYSPSPMSSCCWPMQNIDIADETVAERQTILDLTQSRFNAGLENEASLEQAKALLAHVADRGAPLRGPARHGGACHRRPDRGRAPTSYPDIARPAAAVWTTRCRCPSTCRPIFWRGGPTYLAAQARVERGHAGPRGGACRFLSQHQSGGGDRFPVDRAGQYLHRQRAVAMARGRRSICRSSMPERIRAQYAGATADLDAAVADYNGAVVGAVRQTADAMTQVASLADQRQQQQAGAGQRQPRLRPGQGTLPDWACPARFPC